MSDSNSNITTLKPAISGTPFNARRQTSNEADGALAIGFELNTDFTLSTDGSKVFSLKNNDIEHFNARFAGDTLWGDGPSNVLELKKPDGSLSLQIVSIDGFLGFETTLEQVATISSNYQYGLAELGEGIWSVSHDLSLGTFQASTQSIDPTNAFSAVAQFGSNSDTSTGTGSADFTFNASRSNGVQNRLNFRSHATDDPFELFFDFLNTPGTFAIDSTGKVKGYGVGSGRNKWQFESMATNGASSVGYELNTTNTLSTNGSSVLDLKNNDLNLARFRQGNNLRGQSDNTLFEYHDKDGVRQRQMSAWNSGLQDQIQDFIVAPRHIFWHSNDFSEGANSESVFLDSNIDSTSATLELSCESLDGSTNYNGWASFNAIADATTGGILQLQAYDDAGDSIDFNITSDDQSALGLTTAKAVFNVNGNPALAIADNGDFSIGGKHYNFVVRRTATAVSANTAGEVIIGVTSTASPRTITLDSSDVVDGRIMIIKDESGAAGTNNITVDTEGSELIDGAASVVISANYGVLRVYSNGTNWFSF